ncbi:MAG TPA: ParB-like protein [Alphaproteobacteria bacterium]
MNNNAYPAIHAKLEQLRPTQMTVGYEEVSLKRKEWRERTSKDAKQFLRAHRFPAICGPNSHYYIVDHHHLGRALLEEKVGAVTVSVLSDLSHLDKDEFWIVMDHHQWTHPYDEKGKRRDFSDMPKKLEQLRDDPYRSLAAEVRRAEEYPKDITPFSEFLWADFFRRRISLATLREDPDGALDQAKKLAQKREAAHLPGWSQISKS